MLRKMCRRQRRELSNKKSNVKYIIVGVTNLPDNMRFSLLYFDSCVRVCECENLRAVQGLFVANKTSTMFYRCFYLFLNVNIFFL